MILVISINIFNFRDPQFKDVDGEMELVLRAKSETNTNVAVIYEQRWCHLWSGEPEGHFNKNKNRGRLPKCKLEAGLNITELHVNSSFTSAQFV